MKVTADVLGSLSKLFNKLISITDLKVWMVFFHKLFYGFSEIVERD